MGFPGVLWGEDLGVLWGFGGFYEGFTGFYGIL